jgi:hypothetical protein
MTGDEKEVSIQPCTSLQNSRRLHEPSDKEPQSRDTATSRGYTEWKAVLGPLPSSDRGRQRMKEEGAPGRWEGEQERWRKEKKKFEWTVVRSAYIWSSGSTEPEIWSSKRSKMPIWYMKLS